MAIITISRGSYSRGKEVAEKLAEKLGYKCLSRDILLEASDGFNIPEIKLVRALHDPTSVLERFTQGKERFISYIYSSLLQHIKNDNVVYHGLAGHFLLTNIPHVLKVRIIADMDARVQEEMKRENISAEKALYILQKDDEERRKWGMQMYGKDTWDSRLYDIVLHIGKLTIDDAVDILAGIVQRPNYQSTPESLKIVRDLALSARIKVTLVSIAPKAQVISDDGVVYLNRVDENITTKSREQIKNIIMGIEGVKDVIMNEKAGRQNGHVNPFQNID